MTEIVWIYGSSASGKETFIRRFLENPPKEIRDHLWWSDKKIVCIEESLKYIGKFENDPIVEKRKEIIEKAKKLAKKSNLVILIKGQNVDLQSKLLDKVHNEVPNAKHKIVFLHADVWILFERCKKKVRWTHYDEQEGIEGFKRHIMHQIHAFQKIEGFEMIAIDSSTPNYKPIKFPPKI